jgi:hypothetical protein
MLQLYHIHIFYGISLSNSKKTQFSNNIVLEKNCYVIYKIKLILGNYHYKAIIVLIRLIMSSADCTCLGHVPVSQASQVFRLQQWVGLLHKMTSHID